MYPLSAELERQLVDVIVSLEAMASRDAIRNGRTWIESNNANAPLIAGHIMKRISFLPTGAHRLHVMYLIHDVLQTEAARKDSARPLIRAFKPYLIWIMRPAYQLAQQINPAGEDCPRILRLLQLWVERSIIEAKEAEEMKALVTAAAADLPNGGVSQASRTLPAVPSQAAPPAAMAVMAASQPASRPPTPPAVPRPSSFSPMVPQGTPAAHMNPYTAQMAVAAHPAMMAQRPMQGMPTAQLQAPAMPRLQGYQPLVMPGMAGKQTPETVPVGVLATMMMHAVRRVGRANFVAYRPVDTSLTPQMLPPMEVPTQRLLERVEDFYLDLKDDERGSSSSRSSSSRSASRSGSRSRSRSREEKKAEMGSNFSAAAPRGNFSEVGPPCAVVD